MGAKIKMNELLQRLRAILELESIDETTVFSDCEAWDSLSRLSIISTVDDLFHIQLTGRDLNSTETVRDLILLVEKKMEGPQ